MLFHIFALSNSLWETMDRPMNRIKEVLEEKGIKQTWLAEKLGKSFTIVNSYVCNRGQPSLELLFQIAKILQVNPKDLINIHDE
jgi:DNA-binding protein